MLLGIEDIVTNAAHAEHPGQQFRSLHVGGTHQNGASGLREFRYTVYDCGVLGLLCLVYAVILVVTDETGERLLISKEYRMACGHWVYNFVAGLIDPGESPEESAKRELWEETGLELYEIDDTLDKSIAAIGFSNEKNISIFGKARGEFRPSTSAEEEIIPGWYTKEEVRELLRTEYFAARTQAYCYLWSKE